MSGDPWDKYTLDNPELWQISYDNAVKENKTLRTSLEEVTRERDELVGLVKETVDLLVEMNNLNLKSYALNQEYRIKKILSRTQVQKAMGG